LRSADNRGPASPLVQSLVADQQFYKEQIRLAEAYQVEMRSYTPELPDTTFTQSHVIKDRAHDLHIEFHGRAHTAGDVVVFCPQKRALATGDMIIGFRTSPTVTEGFRDCRVDTILNFR
jgi:glyoxylase-like metal-dependent hydrolase (beta-lactamase superfamily II)